MKLIILSVVAALAIAAPQYNLVEPSPKQQQPQSTYNLPAAASSRAGSFERVEVVPILRDDRVMEEDGRYSLDVETANGIVYSQSGSPEGPEGAVIKAGQYSYTAPDGTLVELKYVADENGFQPQSDLLPIAPEFPHDIPQFVLDQIDFAREEDAARAQAEASQVRSSNSYAAPPPPPRAASNSYVAPQQ
ncbi:hypothetical protein Pmani_003007 [Petrolisthes manimaculis]|uniref:Uncharacterized protein n=1 Tax=Petrolisthes manimaculis TaxID=1843537 RepID=A0AAE1UMX2_9EUCA|nr:hypothetical protein Pmani_003007 [Petrolisthes manimaculis]